MASPTVLSDGLLSPEEAFSFSGPGAAGSSVDPALYSASHQLSTQDVPPIQPLSPPLGRPVDLPAEGRLLDSAAARNAMASLIGASGEAAMDEDTEEDVLRRGPKASDTPGGDCKRLCVRHQRMANGGTNLMLQKTIENLPPNEQASVNAIWSLFSAAPSRRRILILRGLLTIACPSQLSFLLDELKLEMRVDPLAVFPREVSLRMFSYLDAMSLGRAAQVSKLWKGVADDDVLWRTMCEQHIEKKCEKCGWGLPLLGDKKRRLRGAIGAVPIGGSSSKATLAAASALLQQHHDHNHNCAPGAPSSSRVMELDDDRERPASPRPTKRAKTNSPAPSRSSTPAPVPKGTTHSTTAAPVTRPWKSVYCERLAIERNWRKGTCVSTILSGHTDSITCLQVAEDLPHPSFPILMTGSWDRSVRIWNLETGKEAGVLRGHTRGIRALQFDALKLVTGSMDSTLKIWNWRTGECVRTLRGHRDAVLSLAYDKQLLVSGSADHTIRVWDFGTSEGYTLRGHNEWVNSVVLWDAKTASSHSGSSANTPGGDLTESGASSNPVTARESSRGKYLFSASDDMTIRMWDLYERECVRVLPGHVAQVQSLRVITVDKSDFAKMRTNRRAGDAPDGNELATRATGAVGHTPAGRASPTTPQLDDDDDGHDNMALTDDDDAAARRRRELYPPRPTFPAAAASTLPPDPTELPELNFNPLSLPLTPTGSMPILGGSSSSLAAPEEKRPLVVSASLDNTIKVWDVESAQCLRTMFGHIEGVWDVDVDQLRIISGSHDRTLKIWDRDSGRCLQTLVGHTSAVTAVTLRDQYVVTGGDDGKVRVWNFSRGSGAQNVPS